MSFNNMCFTCQPGESDKLFLHQCWHRAVAVSLVEVSALRLPNMPGGIAHEAFKEDSGLLRQVFMLHCVQCALRKSEMGTFLSWGRLVLHNYFNLLLDFKIRIFWYETISKPRLGGWLFLD